MPVTTDLTPQDWKISRQKHNHQDDKIPEPGHTEKWGRQEEEKKPESGLVFEEILNLPPFDAAINSTLRH